VSGELSRRLSAIKALQQRQKAGQAVGLHGSAAAPALPPADSPAPLQQQPARSVVVPVFTPDVASGDWVLTAPFVWQRSELVLPDDARYPQLPPGYLEPAAALSFDLETTGLSGGAGTIAFLAGFARWELRSGTLPGTPPAIRVTQLFLEDYPGEDDFLAALVTWLPSEAEAGRSATSHPPDASTPRDLDALLVTYNGASFDLPLLRTRCIMNGRQPWFGPHRDVLHPSRRLWKHCFDSCSLSAMEGNLLNIRRAQDVPGHEVPARFLASLGSGQGPSHPALQDVFAHHVQDLLSLLGLHRLVASLEEAAMHGRNPTVLPVDLHGYARLVYVHHPQIATDLLAVYWQGGKFHPTLQLRAGLTLAGWYRKQGLPDEAAGIWQSLWESHAAIPAGLELCKHLEHRRKEPAAALQLCTELLSRCRAGSGIQRNLLRRVARLQAKLQANLV